jgi:arylsulfatase A-like enzyme
VPPTAARARQTRPSAPTHLLCLAWSLLLATCGGAPPPPDVLLLITVDTLRADRLGAFGSPLGLTPNLDALAEESALFTAAYAATPFTLPSLSALMTGRHPEELGIFRNESVLPETVPTLASELRDRGWQTQAVVSNFILRRSSGIGSGFDVFDDEFPQLEAVRKWPERIATGTTDAALRLLPPTPRSASWTAAARRRMRVASSGSTTRTRTVRTRRRGIYATANSNASAGRPTGSGSCP